MNVSSQKWEKHPKALRRVPQVLVDPRVLGRSLPGPGGGFAAQADAQDGQGKQTWSDGRVYEGPRMSCLDLRVTAPGYGSKLSHKGTAGFSPGWPHFRYCFLTHCHL